MFSTIIAIRKRDDISREEFIEYYETTHIRLAQKLLPAKSLATAETTSLTMIRYGTA